MCLVLVLSWSNPWAQRFALGDVKAVKLTQTHDVWAVQKVNSSDRVSGPESETALNLDK
jgi:hypothetical protein